MWRKGNKGTKVFEYDDMSTISPSFRSRAIWRQDGRLEVTLNVYTDFQVHERHSKKAMKDMFIQRFGKSPAICICEARNKLRNKDIYVSSVCFYALFDSMPDNCQMEGLNDAATAAMKPL